MSGYVARIALPVLLGLAWLAPAGQAGAAGTDKITIKSPHHGEIEYTTSAKIQGTVTSGGSPVSGQQVELDANPFPYNGFSKEDTATTTSKGGYHFTTKPSHDTRYRVALVSDPTQHSPVLTIYVDSFHFGFHYTWNGNNLSVSAKVRYPTDVNPNHGPVWWYIGYNHPARLKRTATTRFGSPVSPGVYKISHVFKTTSSDKYFQVYEIYRDLPKQGMGRPVCLGPEGWDMGKGSCDPPASVSAKTGR